MRTQKRSKLTWWFSDVQCVGVQYAACHLPPHCARLALPKTDMSILPAQLLPFLTQELLLRRLPLSGMSGR